jgi:N6-adenosine-specific RNA methylase IME4
MNGTVSAIIHDTGEIVGIGASGINLPGRVMQTGLELPEDLSYENWQGIGESLQGVERSLMWWIGDWLRYGERRYGKKYTDAIEATGKDYETVRAAKWVAERFPETVRRRTLLSWSHHKEVAALEENAADQILEKAEVEGWSRNELRRRVSQQKAAKSIACADPTDDHCGVVDLMKLAECGVKFGTIYADPPWRYDNQGTRAATGNHYAGVNDEDGREVQSAAGMSIDEICALPVKDLAADDAHLHLWTTNGFLFECPRIMAAWGFEFRSSLVWVKPQMGIGNYWRNSHEIMLTAIRGNAKRFNDHSIKSWIECDRGFHSAKPEQVRHYIERASPCPYLELFGRREAPNWAVWGNQIERSLFDHAVRRVA